jgi:hypothetical protein
MQSADHFGAQKGDQDPYLAFLSAYPWGSNMNKGAQGTMFYDLVAYGIDPQNADAPRFAERYVHYIHGVNPLGLVYLSHMNDYGAATSVTRFFHTWFSHGSPDWETVGVSSYGPPPGYLTGGANWATRGPAGALRTATATAAAARRRPRLRRDSPTRSRTRSSTTAGRSTLGRSPNRTAATR